MFNCLIQLYWKASYCKYMSQFKSYKYVEIYEGKNGPYKNYFIPPQEYILCSYFNLGYMHPT